MIATETKPVIPWAASLCGFPCPYCGLALLTVRRFEDYPVPAGTAPVAHVNICPACDGHVVTEHEWRRMQETIQP